MKKETYTTDQFLNVLKSYQTLIRRNGKEYPTVVLSDIYYSIQAIIDKHENGGK